MADGVAERSTSLIGRATLLRTKGTEDRRCANAAARWSGSALVFGPGPAVANWAATTWLYDPIYRLTSQQKSGQAATFVYDDGGNLTVKHHEGSNPVTFCYDAGNRLTTSIQGASQLTTFSHDANGNLTGERCDTLGMLLTWTYDNENRCLTEQRPSGANHTYTYHSDGLRWSAHQGGAANAYTFIWDGHDLINEYVSGGLSTRHAVLDGEVLARKQGLSRHVFVPDPLGSVHHLLNSSLNKAATMVYWPYGELQSLTGVELPVQFVGAQGYYTAAPNRVYVRARWYRPDLGRWQTVDPIRSAGGDPNLYGYVGMRPVAAADPNGLLPVGSPQRGPSCGPDVTPELYGLMARVHEDLAHMGYWERVGRCGDPRWLLEWDIPELMKARRGMPYYVDPWWYGLPERCCRPKPECEDTVIVDGECHRTYNVNYVFFGALWRFCNPPSFWPFTEGYQMHRGRAVIAEWKLLYGYREFLGAVEWFEAGYMGWPVADTPWSALTCPCPNACHPRPGEEWPVPSTWQARWGDRYFTYSAA